MVKFISICAFFLVFIKLKLQATSSDGGCVLKGSVFEVETCNSFIAGVAGNLSDTNKLWFIYC